MSEFDDIFAEFEKEFKKVEKKEETSQEIPVSEEGEQIIETEESETKDQVLETEESSGVEDVTKLETTDTERNESSLDDFLSSPKQTVTPTSQLGSVSTPSTVSKEEYIPGPDNVRITPNGSTVIETEKEITIKTKPEEFDFSEEIGPGKAVITIYGHKGFGKTAVALSFPGKIAALSFDRKTKAISVGLYPDRDGREIKVWDAKRYYDESSPMNKLMSAEKTFHYIIQLLDKVIRQWEPDWVLIDGTEIMQEICEMVMRYRNNLMPYQGIANRNLWKERRMYMRQIHNLALDVAKKGIIYTLYPKEHDIRIVDGEVMDRQEMPGWIDVVMSETDTVIKVERVWEEGAKRIFVTVESNKSPVVPFADGIRVDVTNRNPYKTLEEESRKKGKTILQ